MSLQTIGILGGGQLARMSAFAAFRLGFNVAIYERFTDAPASRVTPNSYNGEWTDQSELKRFAKDCNVITLENEFVSPDVLRFLESLGKEVFPSSTTISLIQDKFIQKETLRRHGLPVADYQEIYSKEQGVSFAKEYGFPYVMKSRTGGYDGYGNHTIHQESQIEQAMTKLGSPETLLMAESFIDFEKELATIVARNRDGKMVVYPIVETIQENHICKVVKAPAKINKTIVEKATSLASLAVEAIQGIGVFGVELFLTKDQHLLINELAPRPHNSGHYTIEGCLTSQFENHIRAIMNYPLGHTEMIHPSAVMVNILGTEEGNQMETTLPLSLEVKNAKFHIYGKSKSRVGRKMGHVTVFGETEEKCLSEALKAERLLKL